MKTSRLSRVIQLLTTIQSGQPYTTDDLVRILKVSRRMFHRDLKELEQIGIFCRFDNRVRRYKIDSGFFLSSPNLNSQEALGLLLLAYKARHHIHFPFANSALTAAIKIESDLPEDTKRFCNTALQKISIKADPQERMELLDQKFEQLLEAILKKRVVTVCYNSPFEQENRIDDFSPYHLMYNNYVWYVLGRTMINKDVRVFKLNQIRELITSDKCFDEEEFDLSKHLGRAWSMMPEGRLYNVKLRFLPEVDRSVADIQWHSTQKVVFQDDGSIIMEFRIDGLNEITWWVLSHGDKVQVLAPSALRQKVIKIAENMVRQNT